MAMLQCQCAPTAFCEALERTWPPMLLCFQLSAIFVAPHPCVWIFCKRTPHADENVMPQAGESGKESMCTTLRRRKMQGLTQLQVETETEALQHVLAAAARRACMQRRSPKAPTSAVPPNGHLVFTVQLAIRKSPAAGEAATLATMTVADLAGCACTPTNVYMHCLLYSTFANSGSSLACKCKPHRCAH